MKKLILLSSVLMSILASAQTPAYVPASGLVAWWGLSGNASDSSGNANDLTVNGATLTTDRSGNANSAYLFNGTSNYLTRSSLSYNFSLSGSFSVSFWMQKTGNTTGVAMMSGSGTTGNFIWLMQADATKTIYGTNTQGQSWTFLNGPSYTAQWEHFVAVYNNKSMQLYKNGVLTGSATSTYTSGATATLPFYIGREFNSSGYIAASIDDVGIWNRSLTALEISQLYSSVLGTNETKLKTNVAIAPNPATDFIKIDILLKTSAPYKIIDMNGRVVSQNNISLDKKIRISDLSVGEYFLEIEGAKNLKFIKK